eukprot:3383631-Pyramimonas_sp.AAC.1
MSDLSCWVALRNHCRPGAEPGASGRSRQRAWTPLCQVPSVPRRREGGGGEVQVQDGRARAR